MRMSSKIASSSSLFNVQGKMSVALIHQSVEALINHSSLLRRRELKYEDLVKILKPNNAVEYRFFADRPCLCYIHINKHSVFDPSGIVIEAYSVRKKTGKYLKLGPCL